MTEERVKNYFQHVFEVRERELVKKNLADARGEGFDPPPAAFARVSIFLRSP